MFGGMSFAEGRAGTLIGSVSSGPKSAASSGLPTAPCSSGAAMQHRLPGSALNDLRSFEDQVRSHRTGIGDGATPCRAHGRRLPAGTDELRSEAADSSGMPRVVRADASRTAQSVGTGSVANRSSRAVIPASPLLVASCRAVRPCASVPSNSAPPRSNMSTSAVRLRRIQKTHLPKPAESCRVVGAGGAIPPTHGSPQPMHLPNQTPPAPFWPSGGREAVGRLCAVGSSRCRSSYYLSGRAAALVVGTFANDSVSSAVADKLPAEGITGRGVKVGILGPPALQLQTIRSWGTIRSGAAVLKVSEFRLP